MKNWGPEVLTNKRLGTPPPRHMVTAPTRKFDVDRFAALCEQRGLDPAQMAIEILELERDTLRPKDRLDAAIKLMEYLYPKQRAVEHSGTIGLSLPDLLNQAEEAWHARLRQDP